MFDYVGKVDHKLLYANDELGVIISENDNLVISVDDKDIL